jgi:hypothetical protein
MSESHPSYRYPSRQVTPRCSRRRQAPRQPIQPTPSKQVPVPRPRLGLPGLSLGPAALSVLLHVLVLSSVAGVVLIRPAAPRAVFEPLQEKDFPLVMEVVPVPEETEDQLSPAPDAADTADGAPATALGIMDQPVVDPAMDIVSSSSISSAFLVPSSAGMKTGTALVGMGNRGFGTGQGNGTGKGGKGSPALSTKELFGMKVQAEKIAVILDCSGSMQSVLKTVITEILEAFPNAVIIGTQGCSIYPSSSFPNDTQLDLLNDARDPNAKSLRSSLPNQNRKSALWSQRGPNGALLRQANEGTVDAVYWFADFQDPIDIESMLDIAEALRRAGIRLYVHSVEKEPDASILDTVKTTGGEVIIKRLK